VGVNKKTDKRVDEPQERERERERERGLNTFVDGFVFDSNEGKRRKVKLERRN
jgi:hypothetical protein